MDLSRIPAKELQAELDKRAARVAQVPVEIGSNFELLKQQIREGMTCAATEGRAPKDFKQHVFEAAMEGMYGKEVWKFWNTLDG